MPSSQTFRGRRAAVIENRHLRLTVLEGGGHIAEIADKDTGVNPLWIPPWPSIEPADYDPDGDEVYGRGADAQLLAAIMGHNLCLDIFGGPSDEEAAAGFGVHGEASVVAYEISAASGQLTMQAPLPEARLHIERHIELRDRTVHVREAVENLSATDRPVGWTEHVTLGPPFLEKGVTEFRASATRSKVFESVFGPADYLTPGGGVRLAVGAARRRRHGGPPDLHRGGRVGRLHDAPDGSPARARVLRRVLAAAAAGVRLRVEAVGFPVDGHLGGEPEPR